MHLFTDKERETGREIEREKERKRKKERDSDAIDMCYKLPTVFGHVLTVCMYTNRFLYTSADVPSMLTSPLRYILIIELKFMSARARSFKESVHEYNWRAV